MNRIQSKFVLDALDNEHLLTEWEVEFIDSLSKMPENKELSPKQNEILNRISNKINRG